MRVPLTFKEKHFYLRVVLLSRSSLGPAVVEFLVDTGATYTTISLEEALGFGLDIVNLPPSPQATITANGIVNFKRLAEPCFIILRTDEGGTATLELGAGIQISPLPTGPRANPINLLGMDALAASGWTLVMNEQLRWAYLTDELS